jgi:hypothetical protein
MDLKRITLLALLVAALGGAGAVLAQDAPPPPDQDPNAPPPDATAQMAQADPGAPPDAMAEAPVNGNVDINFFYSNLAPYGHWVQRDSGWGWLPYGIEASWRPYTLGHWVMTDYGWTWVSDEPFGWATYHYGRWDDDPQYGWVWTPGYDWGPAWVAWRNGGGYIGWAPLPSAVVFRAGIGLDFGGVNLDVVLAPTHFCFVEERSFLEPRIATFVAPPARNVTIIRATSNITNYTVVNNRIVNQGVAVQHVEQVTGHKVQRLQVAAVTSGAAHGSQVRGNQLSVFRPAVVKKAGPAPAPPPSARAVKASPTALAQQHQRELENLQRTQAAERTKLQQIQETERRGQQTKTATPPSGARPEPSQGRPAAPANNNAAELAQRHEAEQKAQTEQHQREVQQLQSRQKAEQAQARQQPPRGTPRPSNQEKPKDEKRPATPPPPSR